MRFVVLLCAIWLPGCTHITKASAVIEQRRQLAAAQGGGRGGGFASEFARMVPMGELPTPTDYAHAVVFLASDDARLVTGTDIKVDGGATAKYWPWIPPPRHRSGAGQAPPDRVP